MLVCLPGTSYLRTRTVLKQLAGLTCCLNTVDSITVKVTLLLQVSLVMDKPHEVKVTRPCPFACLTSCLNTVDFITVQVIVLGQASLVMDKPHGMQVTHTCPSDKLSAFKPLYGFICLTCDRIFRIYVTARGCKKGAIFWPPYNHKYFCHQYYIINNTIQFYHTLYIPFSMRNRRLDS